MASPLDVPLIVWQHLWVQMNLCNALEPLQMDIKMLNIMHYRIMMSWLMFFLMDRYCLVYIVSIVVFIVGFEAKMNKMCETLMPVWKARPLLQHLNYFSCLLTPWKCFMPNKTQRWGVNWGVSVSLDEVLSRLEWSFSPLVCFSWACVFLPTEISWRRTAIPAIHAFDATFTDIKVGLGETKAAHHRISQPLLMQPILLPTLCGISFIIYHFR